MGKLVEWFSARIQTQICNNGGYNFEKDAIEIYVDGASIILKKYEPTCIFCGNARNVINYKGKNICSACMKELKKAQL